ncbi:class I SAM-dependent methyltransferase [Maribacter algarum]|uniref:Class I SAM-dependent methyltransferase n=1 Tax=Maribacter algarum (ex Zhang et al. 2020) TaxID=2578118 RepID=A0A5S3PVL2_9FLAO|nr:methyltransferase domain-containing protein [Maribacter algarum]TMM57018.1 class I SAM-dependent methyltransferase [Maribacter algarum]
MDTLRKPLQGVWNIVRFNWHFYILSIGLAMVLLYLSSIQTVIPQEYMVFASLAIVSIILISLLASLYIYDLSGLYSLKWMDRLGLSEKNSIVNINAGFDETSELLVKRYSDAKFSVLDFYDAKKHTEISIKRARKAYPPYPNTLSITTDGVPLEDNSVDIIFAILSAHEIRNNAERIVFFKELKRALKPNGKIVVTEHLRDAPNFLAYTIGFFHFHSKSTWLMTFKNSNLKVSKEIKITPFLTTFVLQNA